jgi:DNA mismatch repair protein MutS2
VSRRSQRQRRQPPAERVGPSLDLHGKTVAEAVDALDVFISDALLGDCDHVRVVHGIGGGKVKAAVHQRLRQLPSIRSFRVDPQNAGVTVVTFG